MLIKTHDITIEHDEIEILYESMLAFQKNQYLIWIIKNMDKLSTISWRDYRYYDNFNEKEYQLLSNLESLLFRHDKFTNWAEDFEKYILDNEVTSHMLWEYRHSIDLTLEDWIQNNYEIEETENED
jgi:hypothetical protein